MKQLIFILLVLITLAAVAGATDFQKCKDKDGNLILTDNPPPDAKCDSMEENEESASQQQQNDDEFKTTGQSEEFKQQQQEAKRLSRIPRVSY